MTKYQHYKILAIPKTSPILTGESARKLINEMQVPKDNSELFERCRGLAKLFKME